jgi:beta-glucosidase
MCSYQRANNSYGCQNSKLLNGILKTEFGFEGFVVSDWGAHHSGVASANAGLDMVMPDAGFWGKNLTQAVNNGSVSAERLDDMVSTPNSVNRRAFELIHITGHSHNSQLVPAWTR